MTFADLLNITERLKHIEPESIPSEDWDKWLALLQEHYSFFILNPTELPTVNFGLWVHDQHGDFPVIDSNTSQQTTFNSRSSEIGNPIKPTETFFTAVGFGFHEAMCFTPSIYFENERYDKLLNHLYDNKPREHERWAAVELIAYMLSPENEPIPELQPIFVWASKHTELGCPVLDDSEPPEEQNTDTM